MALLAAILVISGGILTFGYTAHLFSFAGQVSGAEGPQVSVFGLQPKDSNTINFVNNPSSFSDSGATDTWNSGSGGYNGGLQRCFSLCSPTSLTYDVSIPEASQSCTYGVGLFSNFCLLGTTQDTGQHFSYSGGVGCSSTETCTQKVQADVYSSTFSVELKAWGNSGIQFSGQALWLSLMINIWGIQACDPTNQTTCQSGYVWGAPLEAVITSNSINCGNSTSSGGTCFDQLAPMSEGSAFTLYYGVSNQAPSGTGPIPYSSSNIQSYIQNGGSPLSPDQSLNQYTQAPLLLTNFGPYGCGYGPLNLGTCPVQIVLNVQLYYLVIGSFLWTNPNTTPYVGTPPPGPHDPVQSFFQFLGQIAQGANKIAYNWFLTLIVAAIVIFAIIASSIVMIFYVRRRPR